MIFKEGEGEFEAQVWVFVIGRIPGVDGLKPHLRHVK